MNPIESLLQYRFQKPELLLQALTHKSFANEHRSPEFHNEKLEFLGDAVIDLVLGEYLFELFPSDEEGALSKKRASLVNEDSLARMAMKFDLSSHVRMGRGEVMSGGEKKPRLLAATWEALSGAIYLDGGYDAVKDVLRRAFQDIVSELDPELNFAADYKTRLQEIVQKRMRATPVYELVEEVGPPHDRTFSVAIKIRDQEFARGQGRSKKAAEQQAAKDALSHPNLKEEATHE